MNLNICKGICGPEHLSLPIIQEYLSQYSNLCIDNCKRKCVEVTGITENWT